MSWNNRVVVNEHTYPDGTNECTAQIHEVYYTDGKVGAKYLNSKFQKV